MQENKNNTKIKPLQLNWFKRFLLRLYRKLPYKSEIESWKDRLLLDSAQIQQALLNELEYAQNAYVELEQQVVILITAAAIKNNGEFVVDNNFIEMASKDNVKMVASNDSRGYVATISWLDDNDEIDENIGDLNE